MIIGSVNQRREAVIRLRVRGLTGVTIDVDCVIDTGFTASLTLSKAMVSQLGLVRQSGGSALLADGSTRPFDVFTADIEWDGSWQPVVVSCVGDEPLVGMRLLSGYTLRIGLFGDRLRVMDFPIIRRGKTPFTAPAFFPGYGLIPRRFFAAM